MVIAPNPTLLSAPPSPGLQTAPSTCVTAGWAFAAGAMGRSRATTNSVTSGSSTVASAIAANPELVYSAVPVGAPAA